MNLHKDNDNKNNANYVILELPVRIEITILVLLNCQILSSVGIYWWCRQSFSFMLMVSGLMETWLIFMFSPN